MLYYCHKTLIGIGDDIMKKLMASFLIIALMFSVTMPSKAFFGERHVDIYLHNETKNSTLKPFTHWHKHGEVLTHMLGWAQPGETTRLMVRESIGSFVGPEGTYRFLVTNNSDLSKSGEFHFDWHHPYGSGQSSYIATVTRDGAFTVTVDRPHAEGHTPTINVYIRDK